MPRSLHRAASVLSAAALLLVPPHAAEARTAPATPAAFIAAAKAMPLCVEAVIRYRNGVSITVGIGFDARADRPEQHPSAMWGSLAVKGRGCEFLRHPDSIDAALTSIDETIKAGRCQ
jgi:hypothetical protein